MAWIIITLPKKVNVNDIKPNIKQFLNKFKAHESFNDCTLKDQLGEFLDAIIKPYIPQTYKYKSNKQFLDRINNFQFNTNRKLISFDVSFLFTNVSLEETIQLITKSIVVSEQQDVRLELLFLWWLTIPAFCENIISK